MVWFGGVKLCNRTYRNVTLVIIITFMTFMSLHSIFSPDKVLNSQSLHELTRPNNKMLNSAMLEHKIFDTFPIIENTLAPTLLKQSDKRVSPHNLPRLITSLKHVTSDVRGNLGPPEVVTNELMEDWLTDRWQGKRTFDVITTNGHFVSTRILCIMHSRPLFYCALYMTNQLRLICRGDRFRENTGWRWTCNRKKSLCGDGKLVGSSLTGRTDTAMTGPCWYVVFALVDDNTEHGERLICGGIFSSIVPSV